MSWARLSLVMRLACPMVWLPVQASHVQGTLGCRRLCIETIAGIAAKSDGIDITSISLVFDGLDGVPLYHDPISIATFAGLEKGIFVVTSTSKEGPYLELLHNGSLLVLTVGASSVDRTLSGVIVLDDGTSVMALPSPGSRFSLEAQFP